MLTLYFKSLCRVLERKLSANVFSSDDWIETQFCIIYDNLLLELSENSIFVVETDIKKIFEWRNFSLLTDKRKTQNPLLKLSKLNFFPQFSYFYLTMCQGRNLSYFMR